MSAAQQSSVAELEPPAPGKVSRRVAETTTLSILVAISVSHMLNDMMQSLAPALYPVFRQQLGLTFFETGLITFTFQFTASLLQPLIGLYTDRRPQPYSLPVAMMFTLLATLRRWEINPRRWLMWYLESCAQAGGNAPVNVASFLPWNLTAEKLRELRQDPAPLNLDPDTS